MFAPGACGTRISPCKMHIFAFRTILYLCWTDLYLYITRIICRSYCDRKIAKPCLSGFCAKIALRHFASRLTPWCHSTLSQRNNTDYDAIILYDKNTKLWAKIETFLAQLYIFFTYILTSVHRLYCVIISWSGEFHLQPIIWIKNLLRFLPKPDIPLWKFAKWTPVPTLRCFVTIISNATAPAGFALPQWRLFGNNRSARTRKYKTIEGKNPTVRFNSERESQSEIDFSTR